MSFIERIKKFFSKSKKEVEELPENTISINEELRREFLAQNKVDKKDLLDPKVCKGEKFIENILITCGVDPYIAKSPIVQSEVQDMFFFKMGADKKLITDVHKGYEISSDVIKKSAKKLKKAIKEKTDPKTIMEKYEDRFLVDSKGGIIILGDLKKKEDKDNDNSKSKGKNKDKDQDQIQFNKKGIKKISFDDATYGIIVKEKYHQFYGDYDHKTWQNEEHKIVTNYDKNNIMIRRKDTILDEFYEELDVYHVSQTVRDPKFPFIIHQSIETKSYDDDTKKEPYRRTIYYTEPSIEYLDLYLLNSMNDSGREKEGIKTIDETEDLTQYYESHKEEITNIVSQFKDRKDKIFKGTSLNDLYDYIINTNMKIKKDLEQKEK